MTTPTTAAPLQEWIEELIEEMHGIADNGKWVLIEDPALREFVGRYIGEVISELASCVRDPQAVLAGERLRGGKNLPTGLTGAFADDSDGACPAETWSWRHFTAEQVDAYWIRCTLGGPHERHEDENTGLTWTEDDRDAPRRTT